MNDCAAVNPDGSIETERDTINRLVKNRDELVQHLQSQKEEVDNLLNWIDQKMNSTTNLSAYSYDMGIYHGYKAVKEHIELGKEISK